METARANEIHEEAGCLVVNPSGELLVLMSTNGLWSLPKGHIEPGEIPADAARREVEEETHIVSKPVGLLRRFSFHRRKQVYRLTVFLAVYLSGSAFDEVHKSVDAQWITLDEAFSIPTYDFRYRDCVIDYLRLRELIVPYSGGDTANSKRIRAEERLDPLKSYFHREITLSPLNENARRPLYAVAGEPYTVRLMESRQRCSRSAHAAQLMDFEGVPAVVAIDEWLLTEYVSGTPLSEFPPDSAAPDLLESAGCLLAEIHSINVPEKEIDKAFEEAIAYIDKTTACSLDSLERANLIDGNERQQIEKRIVQWCRESLTPEQLSPVHWDYVPNNLIVHDTMVSVIDFEGSRLFFPAFDFMKACHYLDFFGYDVQRFAGAYDRALKNDARRSLGEMELFYYLRVFAKRLVKPWLDHRPIEAGFRKALNEWQSA